MGKKVLRMKAVKKEKENVAQWFYKCGKNEKWKMAGSKGFHPTFTS